jgi:Tol biopolymer transport system component
LLLAGLVAVLALPAVMRGGSYVPPPGDVFPTWSPDGGRIAFLTGRLPVALAVTAADGSGEARVLEDLPPTGYYPDASAMTFSPDWQWVAMKRVVDSALLLTVVRPDGSGERLLARVVPGDKPAWSHDSRRLAFRMPDGTLAAQGIDGSGFVRLGADGWAPAWSPDGTRIAYSGGVSNVGVHVVGADGRDDEVVAGAGWEPTWSPDGSRIAFLRQGAAEPKLLTVADVDGSRLRSYPGLSLSSTSNRLSWTPDGRAIVYARDSPEGVSRVELATGGVRRLVSYGSAPFGSDPAVSPDGTRIAFAAGGECRDRSGIYVAGIDGAQATRVTNDCRIIGTAGADVLRGTALADVLLGLGGDDRLYVWDPGYIGDTARGGPGDDVLIGGDRQDVLQGGPGADLLRGGLSSDALHGGRGRDRIEGQRGPDRIFARDGQRDSIACGTNVGGTPERDEVWADSVDSVGTDCEVVHRRR